MHGTEPDPHLWVDDLATARPLQQARGARPAVLGAEHGDRQLGRVGVRDDAARDHPSIRFMPRHVDPRLKARKTVRGGQGFAGIHEPSKCCSEFGPLRTAPNLI